MHMTKKILTGAILYWFILFGVCGCSSGGGSLKSTTITVDLVENYAVVQNDVKLKLGTPLVADDLAADNRFLFDVNFPNDSGLNTTIITLNTDRNGTARAAPSADNGYDTNATTLLTWDVDTKGQLTLVVGSGADTRDVLMIPISDAAYSSSNVLAEINDSIGVETRYPSALVPTADFNASAAYANHCANCHGVVPDLTYFTADTLEVRMIQIKDRSATVNVRMQSELDGYNAGELRLLSEYIVSTYP